MSAVARLLLLVGIWTLLWGDLSFANLTSGLLIAAGIVFVVHPGPMGPVVVRPVRVVHLAAYFLMSLVRATYDVARAALAPRGRVHPGIVAITLDDCSDAIATLVADAISLTPGTLTVELQREPLTVYVHAIDSRDVEGLRRDVHRLQALCIRAFGTQTQPRSTP